MDFAFIPGTSTNDFEHILRAIFRRVTNTKMIPDPINSVIGNDTKSLEGFLKFVTGSDSSDLPFDNLFAGSHANEEGDFHMKLSDTSPNDDFTFADLYYLLHNLSHSNYDVSAAYTPRPKDSSHVDIPAYFHLKGCRIGKAKPFLQVLKTLLGGTITVTGPKHFHSGWYVNSVGGKPGKTYEEKETYIDNSDIVEYFDYDFSFNTKDPIIKYDDMIAAFKAKRFMLIDGTTQFPDADWAKLLPKPGKSRYAKKKFVLPFNKEVVLVHKLAGKFKQTFKGQLRHYPKNTSFEFTYGSGTIPATDAAKISDLKTNMPAWTDPNTQIKTYDDAGDFPLPVQWGYSSLVDFIDNVNWSFKVKDAANGVVLFTATWHRYTAVIPITQPSTDNLNYNFYPAPGGTGTQQVTITEKMTEYFESA